MRKQAALELSTLFLKVLPKTLKSDKIVINRNVSISNKYEVNKIKFVNFGE